ncbi:MULTISPECIES: CBS domain-containing protein [Aeromonas]|uniref:CBS domain-containing protein n=1 Tax=Aeromonas TaxID=642 RepID=UPI00191EEE0B|nr:CBS domain-containing protein [Aeromonas caviae]MBL0509663.1 CBS domain-containing protein [Aeromonas caviae]
MGYQLWMSPETGYRRQGTRFESLHKIFLENAKLLSLLEPVLCCKNTDSASDTKYALELRDFDVTCVVNDEGVIIGQIERKNLKQGIVAEYIKNIDEEQKIDENTSLVHLLNILETSEFKYVTRDNQIIGIVTRSDLNKPIPRTYLFGVVSLVELHINFWINHYYPNDIWLHILNKDRRSKVQETIALRRGSSDYLAMVECAQLCDKKEILRNTPEFLARFGFSKKSFKMFLEKLEIVRNEIAHSQSSIIERLSWSNITHTIAKAEEFVGHSDDVIETEGIEKAKGFESNILVPIQIL